MANPSRLAAGTVIEAHLDKKRGPVATLLVQVSACSAVVALNEGACRSYMQIAATKLPGARPVSHPCAS